MALPCASAALRSADPEDSNNSFLCRRQSSNASEVDADDRLGSAQNRAWRHLELATAFPLGRTRNEGTSSRLD